MALDFSECWAKIDRAQEHFISLEPIARADVYSESKQTQLRAEFDSKTGYYVLSVATLPKAWRLQVGLILGDIVHNLRSALDYLFWQLFWEHVTSVTPETIPDGMIKKVQFPIVDRRQTFTNKRRERPFDEIPFRSWAIMNTAQPYKRRNPGQRFLGLQGLRELSDHDKHRVLTPFYDWSLRRDFTKGEFRDRVVEVKPIYGGHRLEIGTKVMQVKVDPPHPDAKVEVAGYLYPSVRLPIKDSRGIFVHGIFSVIEAIGDEVGRVVEAMARHYGEPIP